MTDTTKPKSGGDIKTETMDTDENEQVTTPTTNAVDNSGFAVWCKDNGLSDQVVQTLQDAGFRTPEDLINREKDLIDLVFERKLKPDQFNSLKDAIERMRNASASISVDNTALGLTTMGKQQPSAARGGAPMDAQGVAESESDEFANDHSVSNDDNTTTYNQRDAAAVIDTSTSSDGSAAAVADCQRVIESKSRRVKELAEADIGVLNDEIQGAFKRHRDTNKLDWQKQKVLANRFLISPVPYCCGEIDFLASTEYIGASYNILEAFVQSGFARNIQLRRLTGIVQSFGCGKTRAAVELSTDHVVLPLRVMPEHPLINEVIDAQKELEKDLGTDPTVAQIIEFSESCLRLVHMVLLSLRKLFAHCCVELRVVDPLSPSHRRELALLLLFNDSALVTWALRWFRQHKEFVLRMSKENFTLLVREVTNGQEVVFVIDEVHKLFNRCLGNCLHKDYVKDKLEISRWKQEHQNKKLAKRGRNDLFYQLRRVVHDWYFVPPEQCFSSFVMCSTRFSIWNDILVLESPFTSELFMSFDRLHWFSPEDVRKCIKGYFAVSNELLDAHEVELSLFRRPRFVTTLLDSLAKTKAAADVKVDDWFATGLQLGLTLALKDADAKVKRLANMQLRLASLTYTSTQLLFTVYVIDKLCGGTARKLNHEELTDQINMGIVRLEQSKERGCVQTADPLFSLAVDAEVQEQLTKFENDPVVNALLRMQTSGGLLGDKTGTKGSVCERVLAWIAMRGRLKVTHDGGTVTLRPAEPPGSAPQRRLQLLRASTSEEFGAQDEPGAKPRLLWNVMTGAFCGVLFPDQSCGPDIVFRTCEVASLASPIVVLIQCKNWQQHLTPCNFKPALFSLQPAFYYKCPKDEEPEEQMSANRIHWLKTLADCEGELRKLTIVRIVFAALGFSAEVQYFVREFNHAEARKAAIASATRHKRYIHLLNLDDIKAEIGESAYKSMLKLASDGKTSLVPDMTDTLMLQSEWNALTPKEKEDMSEEKLKKNCDARKINYGHQDKAFIISELNKYDVEAALKERKWLAFQ